MPNNDDQSSSLTCPYCKAPVVRALVEAEVAIGEYDEAEGIHAFAGSMVGYRCTVNPEHGFYLGEVFEDIDKILPLFVYSPTGGYWFLHD